MINREPARRAAAARLTGLRLSAPRGISWQKDRSSTDHGYDRAVAHEGPDKRMFKRGKRVNEDAIPVNAAGPGNIAGIGTGSYPNSEPGVPKKRLSVVLRSMITRKAPK